MYESLITIRCTNIYKTWIATKKYVKILTYAREYNFLPSFYYTTHKQSSITPFYVIIYYRNDIFISFMYGNKKENKNSYKNKNKNKRKTRQAKGQNKKKILSEIAIRIFIIIVDVHNVIMCTVQFLFILPHYTSIWM